jgi:branched-chain amino acid transport system substrate-binding protein
MPQANGGTLMACESDAEPITMGYLMDFRLPDGFPAEGRADLTHPFEFVPSITDGVTAHTVDRFGEV